MLPCYMYTQERKCTTLQSKKYYLPLIKFLIFIFKMWGIFTTPNISKYQTTTICWSLMQSSTNYYTDHKKNEDLSSAECL